MSGRLYLIAASALTGLIFILGNLLVQPAMGGARMDFTEGNLYTLSKGTKNAMGDLAEPVDLTFIYTRRVGQDYPAVRAYASRVRELLAGYKGKAGRNLRIREIDPSPFSEAEDEALAAGITAVETQGTDPLYFGIVGRNAVDDVRVIPFLSPDREASLEYDLTRMITRLDNPEPATVTILSSLRGLQGNGKEDGAFVLREIAKSFNIEQLTPEFVSIPEETDVLLIAHPPELTEFQLYQIDQFLLSEGRAIFLLDPASKAAAGGGAFTGDEPLIRTDLGRLSASYGVILSMDVVADASNALPVNADAGEGRFTVIGQPLYISTPPALMSNEDLITADLSRSVNFGAAGAFSIDEKDGTSFTPMIITGEAPALIDAAEAAKEMTPEAVVKAYEAERGPYVLAGRLSGELKTAFPGGKVAMDIPDDPVLAEVALAAAGEDRPHRTAAKQPVDIIWIADADLLDDRFYINPNGGASVADNSALILNALDNLTGGADLVSLRSRAPGLRPMTRVEAMRTRAQDRFFDEQARLEEKLAASQARLEELQAAGASEGFFGGDLEADLTVEERAELAMLREDIVETRSRLRGIERDFRREIDGLEGTLKAINIWGGPILVGLLGFLMWRRQKRGGDTA